MWVRPNQTEENAQLVLGNGVAVTDSTIFQKLSWKGRRYSLSMFWSPFMGGGGCPLKPYNLGKLHKYWKICEILLCEVALLVYTEQVYLLVNFLSNWLIQLVHMKKINNLLVFFWSKTKVRQKCLTYNK